MENVRLTLSKKKINTIKFHYFCIYICDRFWTILCWNSIQCIKNLLTNAYDISNPIIIRRIHVHNLLNSHTVIRMKSWHTHLAIDRRSLMCTCTLIYYILLIQELQKRCNQQVLYKIFYIQSINKIQLWSNIFIRLLHFVSQLWKYWRRKKTASNARIVYFFLQFNYTKFSVPEFLSS